VFARIAQQAKARLGICTLNKAKRGVYIFSFLLLPFGWVPRGKQLRKFRIALAFVTRRAASRLCSGFDLWPMPFNDARPVIMYILSHVTPTPQ
jgi:hypothetical protein